MGGDGNKRRGAFSKDSTVDELEARPFTDIVRGLLSYAVGGTAPVPSPGQGRRCPDPSFTGDAVYNAITEGRHARAVRAKQFYSSCGDLAHWFLYRMGIRLAWINRDEHDGWHYSGQPGHPAWDNNVTTLCAKSRHGVNPYAKPPDPEDFFLVCGDTLVVNVDMPATTHVSVVYEHKPEERIIVSADYGQPGGALRSRPYTIERGVIRIGSRVLGSVLPILDVIEGAKETDNRRAIETASEWQTRMGLPPTGGP